MTQKRNVELPSISLAMVLIQLLLLSFDEEHELPNHQKLIQSIFFYLKNSRDFGEIFRRRKQPFVLYKKKLTSSLKVPALVGKSRTLCDMLRLI